MIRTATTEDIQELVEMYSHLHDIHEHRFPLNEEDMASWFKWVIESPIGVILMSGGGFISGVVSPSPQNSEWVVGHEAFFWSGDRTGRELMAAFESEVSRMGACEVKYSHPSGSRALARVFERAGNTPSEILYTKAV